MPLRWPVKRSAKNKSKDANLPTFEKTNQVVTVFKTSFYYNFLIKSVVPFKETMQELNSRQMFCTHCGEGLVDRQGKPAVQVKIT